MSYRDITIEQVQLIYNNMQCDIVCDGDKQEVIYEGKFMEFIDNFKEGLLNAFEKLIECARIVAKQLVKAFNCIKDYILKIIDKKISKKKFIKLLQSEGLQRNDINKLIANNKDNYTMWRFLESIPPT